MTKHNPTKPSPEYIWAIQGLFGLVTVKEAPRRRGRPRKRGNFQVVSIDLPHDSSNLPTDKKAADRRFSLERPISRASEPLSVVRKKARLNAGQKRK
jgi:hypothetical protein